MSRNSFGKVEGPSRRQTRARIRLRRDCDGGRVASSSRGGLYLDRPIPVLLLRRRIAGMAKARSSIIPIGNWGTVDDVLTWKHSLSMLVDDVVVKEPVGV